MITTEGVEARLSRLDEMSAGVAKEIELWRKGQDPLLYLERRAYLNAMQDLLAGVKGPGRRDKSRHGPGGRIT